MNRMVACVAVLAMAAGAAFGGGSGDPAGWPLEEYVLQNVLESQMDCGGWGKNQDRRKQLSPEKRAKIIAAKSNAAEATIDNNATTSEIRYLVRYNAATGSKKAFEAAMKGIEWLLRSQLANGGWPQFPGREKGYWTQITFNDNAIRNVLELLRDVAGGEGDFAAFPPPLRDKCRVAFDKGVECVLKCQIRVGGKPTVWCQQHDRKTLAPTNARAYELASFSSQESADLVLFLMSIENPRPEVREAVEGAVAWFRKTELEDGRWARFYDLEETKPFFCDRSGVPRRDIMEIDPERRKGYSWYNKKPAQVLKKYESWRKGKPVRTKEKSRESKRRK